MIIPHQAEADGPTGGGWGTLVDHEAAEQPEVNVQHVTLLEPVEQVLSVSIDPSEDAAIEKRGPIRESPLWRACGEQGSRQDA
jgi:hypothetical protein